jgi:hypothetical protein
LLHFAEEAPAAGVVPSRVTVRTASGTETWFASAVVSIATDTINHTSNTNYSFVAYRDSSVSIAFIAVNAFDDNYSQPSLSSLVFSDSNDVSAKLGNPIADATIDVSAPSLVGPCHDVAGLAWADTVVTCERMTVSISLNSTFRDWLQIPSAYRSFVLPRQPVAGIRIVRAPGQIQVGQ